MKDYKFELKDLEAKDKLWGLTLLLIKKGIITEKEVLDAFNGILDIKNEQLEKALKENPSVKFLYDIFGQIKSDEETE